MAAKPKIFFGRRLIRRLTGLFGTEIWFQICQVKYTTFEWWWYYYYILIISASDTFCYRLYTLHYCLALLQRSPTVTLKLKKTDSDRKVKWGEGTVDNEHMNKKKSKCTFSTTFIYKLTYNALYIMLPTLSCSFIVWSWSELGHLYTISYSVI